MIRFFKNNKIYIWQFARLATISGLVFCVALILVMSILAWLYRDNVKESFLARVNEGLKTEIIVGDLSLNIFRNFPSVSLTLSDVTMLGSAQPTDTLLSASRIYFRLGIPDMIRGNYSVKQLEIAQARINMKLLPNGTNNYTFWETTKQDNESVDSGDFTFQLQSVVFNKVEYIFQDTGNDHTVKFLLQKAVMKGDFTRDTYVMEFNGDLYLDELKTSGTLMAGNRNMNLEFILNVYNNNVLRISKGNFAFGSHTFTSEGILDFSSDEGWIDLEISARKVNLDELIHDLPSAYAKYFEGYRSKGELYFDAIIKGPLSQDESPQVQAVFGIEKGEVYHRKAGIRVEDISFDAVFSNGSQKNKTTSEFDLNDFQAKLNEGTIQGRGSWYNFEEPEIDFRLFSDINAHEWVKLLQLDTVSQASGDLLIDLEFVGKLGQNNTFTAKHFLSSQMKGEIKARDLNLKLKNDPLDYNSVNADFLFNNNDVVVERFSGNASESSFDMNGYFRNVLPWLLLDNERLLVDARLKSGNLNFNQLLQHTVSESDTTYRLRLSDKINFNIRGDIDKLTFRKFEAENVKGTLSMRDKVFYADNISFSTMKGTIRASGFINGKNDDFLVIGSNATFHDVDVHDLFYQMGNFGQTSIQDENLQGRITAQANFVSRWSPSLEIDWKSLETTADIRVENGELINYKPMLALSRFIRVGDLNLVKFSTLENQIRIKDQKIIIPDMEINSDAINIELAGEHTFNNEIEYRLQVLLSDLLARQNRQNRNPQEEYGDIIDDGLGRTTLFLLITGTIDDPVFKYDSKGVREKLREDLRQERENLRNILRAEFGLNKDDSLPDGTPRQPSSRDKEKQEIREREKGKFVIEWDDD
jgi:hypothetical protein